MKKDVPYKEYAPFYWITDDGRVISKKSERDVKPSSKHHGYQKVKLRANGQEKSASLARMVALAFIPTEDTSMDVDHIDNNKLNNHVSNLQWLTRSENVAKSWQQGRVHPRKGKLSGKLTGFYLSHKARELISGVDNKSKFVGELIEAHFQNTPSPKNTNGLKLEEIIKPEPKDIYEDDFKAVVITELECCQHPTRPCKHWVWDTDSGDGYKNSLSGRYKEAE